tara:strand:- start:141 stop:677 length:537 start_codon:yes stop_codon:yes gene_type:complete
MGTYVYVVRKRPINVLINEEIVPVYPLEYFSREYDVSTAWEDGFYSSCSLVKGERSDIRRSLGRAIRAMRYVPVEYVFMNSMDSPMKAVVGSTVHKFTNKEPLDNITSLGYESSCYGGPDIFYRDYADVGDTVGALVRPTKRGAPWTVEPYGVGHYEMAWAEVARIEAERRARRGRRA